VVEDVAWHKTDPFVFGSVGDDKKLKIWDTRQSKSVFSVECHTEEALCLDFSPFNSNLLLTGSVDKTVAMWDRRNLKASTHIFKQHQEEVNTVKYHPHHENLFASGSSDRRIIIWDVARIGAELTDDEKKDGPPEMMFMHGGHTAKITDMSWNPNERNMIASVAEDNIVQVWQIAREIYYDDPSMRS
jgi:WD40 repeat protein